MELTVHIGFDDLIQAIGNLPADQRQRLRVVLDTNVDNILPASVQKRTFGTMPGLVAYIADDFDAPLADFDEYM